jgi:gamma-glutamyltranspeptidase
VTVPFSWDLPYAWPRKPVLAGNVVCTTQPLAAQAGLAMLADGGNAVDAIIATAITITLVEPVSNGLGSDAFAIVWDGEKLHGLNASGRSPAAWTREYFNGVEVPARGWNSVTVPGAVSAWVELHAKFGKLPSARLFERAIHYGRDGFLVCPTIAGQWAAQVSELKSRPGFADAFLPGGRAPLPGELFRFPEHAATLEKIPDAAGMMVSMIQSNNQGFGSGVVVPGTGISLHNRGANFVATPGHPNQIGPRKRPYHTIIPGFVTKQDAPVMTLGVMGGPMQPQGHLQVIVRIADYGQNPQAACDGPRFRWVQGLQVTVEDGFPAATGDELRQRGHDLVSVSDYNAFGACQAIWRLEDGYLGVSDPRRDGQAAGF